MFIFWTLWPYCVVRMTKIHYYKHTGQTLSKDQAIRLRRELARITGPIVKPDSPKGET